MSIPDDPEYAEIERQALKARVEALEALCERLMTAIFLIAEERGAETYNAVQAALIEGDE